jgi:hypothetical protein
VEQVPAPVPQSSIARVSHGDNLRGPIRRPRKENSTPTDPGADPRPGLTRGERGDGATGVIGPGPDRPVAHIHTVCRAGGLPGCGACFRRRGPAVSSTPLMARWEQVSWPPSNISIWIDVSRRKTLCLDHRHATTSPGFARFEVWPHSPWITLPVSVGSEHHLPASGLPVDLDPLAQRQHFLSRIGPSLLIERTDSEIGHFYFNATPGRRDPCWSGLKRYSHAPGECRGAGRPDTDGVIDRTPAT